MMLKRLMATLLWLTLALGMVPAQAQMVTVAVGGSSSENAGEKYVQSIAEHQGSIYLLYGTGELARLTLDDREPVVVGGQLTVENTQLADLPPKAAAPLPQQEPSGPALGGELLAEPTPTPEPTQPEIAPLTNIFSDGSKLYGLTLSTGDWYTLLDATGGFAPVQMGYRLDTSAMHQDEEDSYMGSSDPAGMFVQDGNLFYTIILYGEEFEYRAGSVNLQTGQSRVFSTPYINELTPWKDGKLICRVYDQLNAFNMETGELDPPEYGFFDPFLDMFTPIGNLGEGSQFRGMTLVGMCGDTQSNTLYYAAGSRIFGIDMVTAVSRISAYTGEGMFGSSVSGAQQFFMNGHYVQKAYAGVDIYALDLPAVKSGALRIYGEFGSDAHKSFSKNYPDIPLDVAEEYTVSLEALTNAMVSEDETYDVLLLNMSYMPVERLIEKGYALDLTQFPEIMEIMGGMDPLFVDSMTVDGKLYGAPVGLSCHGYAVDMTLWEEELGLTREELPTTLSQLFEFIANWDYDYLDDYPDMKLFNISPMKDMLFSMMVEDYISYTQKKGEPLLFDTEAFRGLLTAFEAIDFTLLDEPRTDQSVSFWGDSETLFSYDPTVGYFDRSGWTTSVTENLPLSLVEGEEPVMGANLEVLIINPKTKRLDQAVLYITNYLQNLSKTGANITLFPDNNQPVDNPYYDINKTAMEEIVAQEKALLEAADETNKAELEDRVAEAEKNLANIEKNRYLASAEQIADFRTNIRPLLWMNKQSVLYSEGADEFSKFFQQYLQGAMGQDQFLNELDKRLKMMEMEAQ